MTGLTFCGPRLYELFDGGDFLSLDADSHELTYSLPEDEMSYLNTFTARVVVSLVEFPAIPSIELIIPVEIIAQIPEEIIEETVVEPPCEVEDVILADGSSYPE